MKIGRALSGSFLILALSRGLGLLREFLILVAFGFSRVTDIFYVVTLPLVSLLAIANGPFTTAFAARLNQARDQDRLAHVRHYSALCRPISLVMSALFLLAALASAFWPGARQGPVWAAIVALVPAAAGLVYVGYVYALTVGLGMIAPAAGLMLVMNATFVITLSAIWYFGITLSVWILPTAYTIAAITCLIAARMLAIKLEAALVGHNRTLPNPKPLPGLRSSFVFAGAESAGFLLTQYIVIALAAGVGAGWVSAVSLAQRFSFSIIGLIISPLASLVMISVMRSPRNANAIFARGWIATLLGLSILAAILIAAAHLAIPYLHLTGDRMESVGIFLELLPAYAVWMIPAGASVILCRTMFGLDMDKRFTAVTICGYLFANLARLIVTPEHGLPRGLLVGAMIELGSVLYLYTLTSKRLASGAKSDIEIR